MLDEKIKNLEQRVAAMEKWRSGHDLDRISANVNRVITLIDGDDRLGVRGLRKSLENNTTALQQLVKLNEQREIQQKTLTNAIKLLSAVGGASLLPQIWQLVQLISP